MKIFWRKYGVWIEATGLILILVLMVCFRFWEEEHPKAFIRWIQFGAMSIFLIDRVLKIKSRLQKAE